MFRKVISWLVILGLLSVCVSGCAAPGEIEPVSILFSTDTHYLSPDLTDGGPFFKDSIAKGDGKVIEYAEEIHEAFFSEVIAKQPDLLVLGGDLTLNGAVQSHLDFIEKLQKVQDAGIDVLVIPGNHDVDMGYAYQYVSDGAITVEALTSPQFFEYYSRFGRDQAISRDENSFSYMYEAGEKLRILMIDTNCGVAGTVREETLDWIKTALKQARRDGADVIAVTHQNLFAHNPLLSFGYQINNAGDLQALFEKYKVRLVLSGHIHIQSVKAENGITEIVTSSLEMAPIQYGALTYDGDAIRYAVQKTDVSGWAAAQNKTDPVFRDFEAHAVEYFEYTSRLKVEERLADAPLTDAEKALIADTFAKANTLYFAGEPFDPAQFSDGLQLMEELELSFYTRYINSILDTAETEKQQITVIP